MEYDYEIVREGLKAIENRANLFFEKHTFKKEDGEIILSHILTHFIRIGKLAASKKDEDSTFETITCCINIGLKAAKFKLVSPMSHAIDAIGIIGIDAANHSLEFTAIYARDSLVNLDLEAKKQGLESLLPPKGHHINNINEALNKS